MGTHPGKWALSNTGGETVFWFKLFEGKFGIIYQHYMTRTYSCRQKQIFFIFKILFYRYTSIYVQRYSYVLFLRMVYIISKAWGKNLKCILIVDGQIHTRNTMQHWTGGWATCSVLGKKNLHNYSCEKISRYRKVHGMLPPMKKSREQDDTWSYIQNIYVYICIDHFWEMRTYFPLIVLF